MVANFRLGLSEKDSRLLSDVTLNDRAIEIRFRKDAEGYDTMRGRFNDVLRHANRDRLNISELDGKLTIGVPEEVKMDQFLHDFVAACKANKLCSRTAFERELGQAAANENLPDGKGKVRR